MDWSELKDRLQNLTPKKVTNEYLGNLTGTTSQNISKKVKNKSEVTVKELALIEKRFSEDNKTDSLDFISLPVKSEVTASMGYGVDVYNENKTGTYQFSKKLLNDIGANPNYSDVIFSSGDSMYPTIEGGDCLVVDKSRTEIHDGKIYCVRIDGQLYAKRLQKIPPNKIKITSDNLKYDAFYIDFDSNINYDFAVIGEVKWWSRVAR